MITGDSCDHISRPSSSRSGTSQDSRVKGSLEVHDPQLINRAQRWPRTPVVHEINMPTEEQINAVLGNKKAIQMELTNGQ